MCMCICVWYVYVCGVFRVCIRVIWFLCVMHVYMLCVVCSVCGICGMWLYVLHGVCMCVLYVRMLYICVWYV